MGTRGRLVIVLLLGLALILALVAYLLGGRPERLPLHRQPVAPTPLFRKVEVVVAKTLLAAGQPIRPDELELLRYPVRPTGSFDTVSELVGKTPAVNIVPQSPVLRQNLLAGLATHIAPGNVAMAITANPVLAVGYHLQPGDWVDVFDILSGQRGAIAGRQAGWPTQSRLLLANLRVLAVGPRTVSYEPKAPQKDSKPTFAIEQEQEPRTLVLQVPLAAANTLALASQEGHILLALRSPVSPAPPDVAAFPQPSPVLLPSRLPLGQWRQVLRNPGNRAYAGETLSGLAGLFRQSNVQEQDRHIHRPPVPTVQIIRGGQVSRIPY